MVESDLAGRFRNEGSLLLTPRKGPMAATDGVKPVESAFQRWAVILPLSQVLLGCRGEPNACYGVELGARYDIELVERYDETSSYLDGPSAYGAGCGADFDITVGDRLRIEIQGQRAHPANDCLGSLFIFTNPEAYGWEILGDRHDNQFPRLLLGQFDARVHGCDVTVR